MLCGVQVVAEGNAQLQQLVEAAQQAAAQADIDVTTFLANVSAIAAVQQGDMSNRIRDMASNVATALQANSSLILPSSSPILEELIAVSSVGRQMSHTQTSTCECVIHYHKDSLYAEDHVASSTLLVEVKTSVQYCLQLPLTCKARASK